MISWHVCVVFNCKIYTFAYVLFSSIVDISFSKAPNLLCPALSAHVFVSLPVLSAILILTSANFVHFSLFTVCIDHSLLVLFTGDETMEKPDGRKDFWDISIAHFTSTPAPDLTLSVCIHMRQWLCSSGVWPEKSLSRVQYWVHRSTFKEPCCSSW